MTIGDIREVVSAFAEGARRARDAGLDGVELHGANGYLITQFLSSAINDRQDEYGGSLENRARFVLDIVRAIRARVGRDFHLQMKISATEYNDALLILKLEGPGNTVAGVGAGLQMAGRSRRRRDPRLDRQFVPASAQPGRAAIWTWSCCPTPTSSSRRAARNTFRNLLLFHNDADRRALPQGVARRRRAGGQDRGTHAARCSRHQAGGQRAGHLHGRLPDGVGHPQGDRRAASATRVSMARPLVANNDLVKQFAGGPRPRRAPVHLLQQVPRARRRAPARLLRGKPLPEPRRRCSRR